MHHWGDEWFEKNGTDLDNAIRFCTRNWRRWGRIGSHGKEKYGTFRHHPYGFQSDWPIHSLVKPGHVYYRWPKLIYKLELALGTLVSKFNLGRPIFFYQGIVYNAVLQIACKRWPHLIDELMMDTDWWDAVRPGIWGPLDGKTLKSKYWITAGSPEDILLQENRAAQAEEEAWEEYLDNLDEEEYLSLLEEAWAITPRTMGTMTAQKLNHINLMIRLKEELEDDDR